MYPPRNFQIKEINRILDLDPKGVNQQEGWGMGLDDALHICFMHIYILSMYVWQDDQSYWPQVFYAYAYTNDAHLTRTRYL